MKKIFVFMIIALVGCVGADEIPKMQSVGSGAYGGYSSMSKREYENNLYWYCLGLAKGSTKRKWKNYMSSDDHMKGNYYSPLHCKRFSTSPRKLLKSAKKSKSGYGRNGRDGASYYGGIGGQGGGAGSGFGGGYGGNGGAGIYGGQGGRGGKGGSAF